MITFKRYILLTTILLVSIPAFANAALSDYFVNTAWLAEHRSQVVVLDTRNAPLFLLGHIDGARHLAQSEYLDTRDGVKSLVPTTTAFEALMEKYGITPETIVVVYAEHDNPYSARLAWTLRYYGHENSLVLDGGYEKWAKEGRPTSLLPTTAATPSHYRVSNPGKTRAEADYVLTQLGNPAVIIWDTRTPQEYDGSKVRADRGGHIPGATPLNWTELQKEVDGVRVLKSDPEIRDLLAEHGITDDHEIIAHCQTGIRSSYATLVLLGLGYGHVKNYDGSWIEWANNPTLPIVEGAGKSQHDEIALLRN
jgi:thiosulfate/3-mercaptopyruvate sulfurtransferase